MNNRIARFLGATALVAALAGCAGTPPADSVPPPVPASSLGEARVVVGEAQAAGYNVEDALVFLRRAEQAAAEGDETAAIALAEQAKQAVAARRAIEEAKPVVASAISEAGVLASDASKVLEAAEAALKAGDPLRASELAAQARRQAAEAVELKKAELARAARDAANRYRVVRGDSLWTIAARQEVYGDARQWPLLFRANHPQVKDPDLLRPGQQLVIDREPGAQAVEQARRHSRQRKAWKVGPLESADRAYLEGR